MTKTRQELAEKIKEILHNTRGCSDAYVSSEFIDLIIADRKAILDEVKRELNGGIEWSMKFAMNPPVDHWNKLYETVEKSLTIIRKYQDEGL